MHCYDSSHIIGRRTVCIAESLSNKDRPLEVEEIDRRKDITETCIHDKEEKHTLIVLNDLVDGGSFLIV